MLTISGFESIILSKQIKEVMNSKIKSVQKWLPIECIYNSGLVKTKEKQYIKILQVEPINLRLKTEKEISSIVNSYINMLRIINFDIQVLIQSEDDKSFIRKLNIEEKIRKEKNIKIKNILKSYYNQIINLNSENKTSVKKFFILIKDPGKENIENVENKLIKKYTKIKELLSNCGNEVYLLDEKAIKEIFEVNFRKRREDKLIKI